MDITQFYEEIRDIKSDETKSFNVVNVVDICTKIYKHTPLRKLNRLNQIANSAKEKSGYDASSKMYNVVHNEEKYKNLYNILSDERSKKTLLCVLMYRLTGKYTDLHAESDYEANQYFDKDIMSFTKNEVFADCGGFVGDTTDKFINNVCDFSKIYVYEPNPNNCAKASHLLSLNHPDVFNKIIIRDAGVGLFSDASKISFSGAGSHISENGDCMVKIVSLDADIKEPISFIKMDVEGFELDALKGARQHIISEKPKMAICVYHKLNDLWELPQYILSLNPSYRLYLRQYILNDGENSCETVLYAV